MILVDTSVWIDDFRQPSHELRARVAAGDVLSHHMVIGELACGHLPDRGGFLGRLRKLPVVPELASDDLLALIEEHALMGRGIGYVDANLVGSVLAYAGASLWRASGIGSAVRVAKKGSANGTSCTPCGSRTP